MEKNRRNLQSRAYGLDDPQTVPNQRTMGELFEAKIQKVNSSILLIFKTQDFFQGKLDQRGGSGYS